MAFKFILAFALCYWLFTAGKIDLTLISKSFELGYLWILGLVLLVIRTLLNAARFQVLLEAKAGESLPYLKILSFDAVGSFFSIILPGASAGDVVRFFYYKNISKKLTKSTTATLLILDRFIGLIGLMGLGTLVCIFQYESIKSINPALLSLVYINAFLFLSITLVIVVFFTDILPQDKWLLKFASFLSRWPKIHSVITEMLTIKIHFNAFIKGFLLTIVAQTAMVTAFWALASPFIPESVSFLNLLTVIPIGMIGASLPISPGGLGVGHLLFENLFKMLQINNGASLFNLNFLANVAISLLGVIPYFLIKSDLKKS